MYKFNLLYRDFNCDFYNYFKYITYILTLGNISNIITANIYVY
ncbi:hypothetical protein CPAST_c27240 [Clostridium pasteurianum DSM 525 = ATCC 6013]|uniref:Uncharacterized protein n=1 Tax=Clostridium pasteurianum DSM 525 = ATCC 6013 TaxID=1262449 RepID=A0A0H3J4C8_CLOPA|nr:hypothetical protein CPAST_c27240 [Clostridium pasteurianum DSM 525 = ATCC 6013]AJA52779.1 hypothetical protein CLPA_c27240 [Clostridium pasteurianum DSM 525 = ATCC 6013]